MLTPQAARTDSFSASRSVSSRMCACQDSMKSGFNAVIGTIHSALSHELTDDQADNTALTSSKRYDKSFSMTRILTV